MREKLLLIVVFTILASSALVGCSQNPSAASTLTILSITEGNVFVMKAGTDSWIEAQVGMSLEPGDMMKTDDGSSAEITFFDGSTIELWADTSIEIVSLDTSADTGSTTITLGQTMGTTLSRVIKLLDPASRYEIETPTGVAAVRGSIMIVRIIEDGTTWITNQQGDIWAIAQGVELQIPEGRTGIIVSGHPPVLIPLNDPPVAEDDAAITDEDNPVTVAASGVLNNDSDPDVGDSLAVMAVDTSSTTGAVTAWDADGSFTYDPSGQFEHLQAGGSTTDSFDYTVSDGNGGMDTGSVTITVDGVNDVPTGISLDSSSVAENQPSGTAVGSFSTTDPDTGDTFTYSLVRGEGDHDNGLFTIAGSQLQTVVGFDYETRNFYCIRVRTTDSGSLYYEEALGITITDINDPPVAADDGATTPEDTPVTIDVLTNDFDADGDTLTVKSVTQGTSGSVINNGGDVTYSPDPGSSGTDSFTYTVSDGSGRTDTATVTITVTGINHAPTGISLDNSSIAENEPPGTVVGDFSTTDPDTGDTFTYSLVNGEGDDDNASFTIVGNQLQAVLSFDYETTSVYSIRVRTTDSGTLYYEQASTITVTDVNDPPVAEDDNAATPEDTPVTIDVLSNDSDVDGDTLTVQSVTQGTNGSVINNGGDVTYSPEPGFSGTDSFTYTVSDGSGGTDTATVTITVTGINHAPTDISLDNSNIAENEPPGTTMGGFSSTDPDTGDTFTYSLVSGEGDDDNAWFAIAGSLLQTAASFDYETKNSCSIRVRTTDSGTLYYEEAFIITITDINDPPVAVDDSDTTPEDTPVTIDVLSNDSDVEGDTLTVQSVTQGTNGSVTNSGGDVTYTPDPGFSGTDSFTYTVSDGNGGTDTATVTVTVTAIKTLARINVQIDTGPTASIFIWDDTTNSWATDEDTQELVDGTNHVTSDTITVAGGHYYYVWVEAADVTYYVKNCPKDWIITTAPAGDAEAAYGYAGADSLGSVHFTVRNGSD